MQDEEESILAPDNRQRVTFYRRSDGYYEYSIDKFYVDDLPEYSASKAALKKSRSRSLPLPP